MAKLFKQKNRCRSNYRKAIEKARKEGNPKDEIGKIASIAMHDNDEIDEEISILATDYLLHKARRLFVFIPPHDVNDFWERCNLIDDRYVLSSRGISELRTSLRKENKEKVELLVVVLSTLTGIVGAVTGLLAIILK